MLVRCAKLLAAYSRVQTKQYARFDVTRCIQMWSSYNCTHQWTNVWWNNDGIFQRHPSFSTKGWPLCGVNVRQALQARERMSKTRETLCWGSSVVNLLVWSKHATTDLSFNDSFKDGLQWLFKLDVIELVLDSELIYNTTHMRLKPRMGYSLSPMHNCMISIQIT